jgi:hypothetical protein
VVLRIRGCLDEKNGGETALQELTNKSLEYRSHAIQPLCMIHLPLVVNFLKQATPSPNDCPSAEQINAKGKSNHFVLLVESLCSPLLDVMHNEYIWYLF